VSEEEYEYLVDVSKNVGMSVPSFCKMKVKGVRVKSPKIDRQGASEIASELRRIGTNVNQIAKHTNMGGNVSEGEIKAVQEELMRIWQLLNSALQK